MRGLASDESIGGDETRCDQLIHCFGKCLTVVAEVAGEGGAARAERFENVLGAFAQHRRRFGEPCGGVWAREERHAGGQARPSDFAAEAECVEERGVVAVDALREDVTLPGVGGDLEAVELLDDFLQAVDAGLAAR